MVNVKQLLAQKLFGVHLVPSKTQAELQRVYTGLGAEFGQPITDANITFAVKREPVAHRIVFAVAHDVFDNWFEVELLQELVREVREIRKNLDLIKIVLEDMKTRFASIETSRIGYPEETRYV